MVLHLFNHCLELVCLILVLLCMLAAAKKRLLLKPNSFLTTFFPTVLFCDKFFLTVPPFPIRVEYKIRALFHFSAINRPICHKICLFHPTPSIAALYYRPNRISRLTFNQRLILWSICLFCQSFRL